MITVLYICPDPSLGGSTRSLINLIASVKGEVYPIVLLPIKGEAYDYLVENGIETIVCPYVLLHDFFYSQDWKRVVFHPWRMKIVKYWRLDWKCVLWVKYYLNGRKIDVVHSNFSPVTVGLLLAKVLKTKHVWHIREFLDLHFHYSIYLGIPRLRRKINHADARVAISNAVRKHWKLREANTYTIMNPICSEVDAFYIREKEQYLLLCSYFLTEAKGTRVAIIAFGISGLFREGYRLKLVGNCTDEYQQSLMYTAKEYGCEEYVDFVPCQSDMKPFFATATAYIMASECEGLGRVTAEAMFYGCPVVAHATGGTLDLVKDGETGYLFNTVEECAVSLRKVCSSDNEQMILRAQEFVKDNLSQEVYGPKIMDVYKCVLGK